MTEAKARNAENLQVREYATDIAREFFVDGKAHSDKAKEFLGRVVGHTAFNRPLTEEEYDVIAAVLYTLSDDLFHYRHSDQTALDLDHGDWLKNLNPGDMIWAGAQWWNGDGGMGHTEGGGHAMYFLRYDLSEDIIHAVDEISELKEDDPYTTTFDARTLHRSHCNKYKLFPADPLVVKELCEKYKSEDAVTS